MLRYLWLAITNFSSRERKFYLRKPFSAGEACRLAKAVSEGVPMPFERNYLKEVFV